MSEKTATKPPVLLLKKSNMAFLRSKIQKGPLIPNVKIMKSVYREEVLYETNDVYFLKGEYQRLIVVNRLNLLTKGSRTTAKYYRSDGSLVEKTSDSIILLIGQEQYDTILTALCAVINQELRIRGILALLTASNTVTKIMNMDQQKSSIKHIVDKSCQTDECRLEFIKPKPRRRIKRQLTPYVVQDIPIDKKMNKLIIHPNGLVIKEDLSTDNIIPTHNSKWSDSDSIYIKTEKNLTDTVQNSDNSKISEQLGINSKTCATNGEISPQPMEKEPDSILPDLGPLHDETSRDSIGNYSSLSIEAPERQILYDPMSMLNTVDQRIKDGSVQNFIVQNNYKLILNDRDRTEIGLPYKPEDDFHVATKENLMYLDEKRRKQLLKHQMMIDLKHCLTVMDEDGNLPIHLAVLNNDLELLQRQCIVLKIRDRSVDTPANGLTALKLSLFQDTPATTTLLLDHGADPLLTDEEGHTCAHIAAELRTDHLQVVVDNCRRNVRKILLDNEELMKPGVESKPHEVLAAYLFKYIFSMPDKQGYNALMLASLMGHYNNVRLILECAPDIVNLQMSNTGNTALYLAVAAACNASEESGNKSKVLDHFRKTIEILLENRADPAIDNYSGSNVNILLTEFNCAEMSMLVANKLTYTKFLPGESVDTKNFDKLMLVRDKQGNVGIKDLDNKKKRSPVKKSCKTMKATDKKAVESMKAIDKIATKTVKATGKVAAKNIILTSPGQNTDNIPGNKCVEITIAPNPIDKNIGTGKKGEKRKPIIVENILITPPTTKANSTQLQKVDSSPKPSPMFVYGRKMAQNSVVENSNMADKHFKMADKNILITPPTTKANSNQLQKIDSSPKLSPVFVYGKKMERNSVVENSNKGDKNFKMADKNIKMAEKNDNMAAVETMKYKTSKESINIMNFPVKEGKTLKRKSAQPAKVIKQIKLEK